MKARDIHAGEDYELRPYAGNAVGDRVTVLEVGAISRRVRSGARHDWGGHAGSGVAVRVRHASGREEVTTPNQVNRPWAQAEAAHEAHLRAAARQRAAVEQLGAALRALLGPEASRRLMLRRHGHTDWVECSLNLTVDAAERLASHLEQTGA